jgi:hypothetical protein
MSAQPTPRADWFVIMDQAGEPFIYKKMFGPFLVRNQAELTMFCEKHGLDPRAYVRGKATQMDLATGQIAADYCKPASAYELPPEVVASLRRRDSYNAFVVKLEHDGVQHVGSEVPTSEAEAAALDALIAELDSLLARCYELQRYEPKEDEDE